MRTDTADGVWAARRTELRRGLREHVTIAAAGRTLTFGEVIEGWRGSEAFRAFFIGELAATPFPAFFWEMPPIRQKRTEVTYEYVAIRSDALASLPADPDAFESKFRQTDPACDIATFPNLGRDALLVAPRPLNGPDCYGHLGVFVRSAPRRQQHALFRSLGRALGHVVRICDGGLWTSTSGLGVPWLHIRLDSFPKYYNHQPFAIA